MNSTKNTYYVIMQQTVPYNNVQYIVSMYRSLAIKELAMGNCIMATEYLLRLHSDYRCSKSRVCLVMALMTDL